MPKELPIKKEYLLIAGAVILLLVSYHFAFKKTIEAWQFHSSLKQKIVLSTDVSYQPQYLERKNNNLARIINLYKADSVDFRSNIINAISTLAEKENVKLSQVPTEDPFYHTTRFIIQKLNFEGDYFSLIKTLNRLQSTKGIGMIRAINFKTTANPSNGNRVKKLGLEVYLEINAN